MKFIVIDNEFNRAWYPEYIGLKFTADELPAYAQVEMVQIVLSESEVNKK